MEIGSKLAPNLPQILRWLPGKSGPSGPLGPPGRGRDAFYQIYIKRADLPEATREENGPKKFKTSILLCLFRGCPQKTNSATNRQLIRTYRADVVAIEFFVSFQEIMWLYVWMAGMLVRSHVRVHNSVIVRWNDLN